MQKLFILAAVCFLVACSNDNNRPSTDNKSAQQTTNNGIPKDSVARDVTFSFVDGCMDNFRVALGEEKAFAFCKCIYTQIKAENPNADSVQVEQLAMDTARVAKMAANCR